MSLRALEDRILSSMDSSSTDLSTALREVLQWESPSSLRDFIGVGLDANAIKQLRRNRTLADRLTSISQELDLRLIIPSQSITEFWNNHENFFKEDWGQVQSQLETLRKKLVQVSVDSQLVRRVTELTEEVADLSRNLRLDRSENFIERSREMIDLLLSAAIVPRVSRQRFSSLSEIRQLAKNPPGFADEARKFATRGDFFVWCEFLMGAVEARENAPDRGNWFLFVSDEAKPDWKTGDRLHPDLAAEAFTVCSCRVALVSTSKLDELMTEAAAALDASPVPLTGQAPE